VSQPSMRNNLKPVEFNAEHIQKFADMVDTEKLMESAYDDGYENGYQAGVEQAMHQMMQIQMLAVVPPGGNA